MNRYETINAQLTRIPLADDRAAAQRWFLGFLAANTRLPIDQAASIAAQVLGRWGLDVIHDSHTEEWTRRPLPATRQEWEADGYRVPDSARPLLVTDREGIQQEYFLLFDVEVVDEGRVGTVDHQVVRDPAPPVAGAPTLSEFALQLGERERNALGHLWKVGTVVEWADVGEEPDEVYTGPLGWIEPCDQRPYCRPTPEQRGEDACFRILIHPDADGSEVMSLVMALVAELLTAWVQGRRMGRPFCGQPEETVSDLEVGLVSWLVGRRLGMGGHFANVDTFRFLESHMNSPVPEGSNWGRILETAQVMEDLLLGDPSAVLPGPGAEESFSPRLMHVALDPYGAVGRELAVRKFEQDGEAAERWVMDFVSENPRFTMPCAVALGWQLYLRWGVQVAGDASRADWVGSMDLRSVEEWLTRGWVPRPGAEALVAAGSHGQPLSYFLRDDVVIADRLSALQSEATEEPDLSLIGRLAPEDAPDLEEFRGRVTPVELEMLRNLWRVNIVPEVVPAGEEVGIDLRDYGAECYRLPVVLEEGVNPMPGILGHVSNWMLAHQLGVIATAPIVGARFFAATEWECVAVAHIVGARLGIGSRSEDDEVLEEAFTREDRVPGLIRWGLVFHTAEVLEDTLRGLSRSSGTSGRA